MLLGGDLAQFAQLGGRLCQLAATVAATAEGAGKLGGAADLPVAATPWQRQEKGQGQRESLLAEAEAWLASGELPYEVHAMGGMGGTLSVDPTRTRTCNSPTPLSLQAV